MRQYIMVRVSSYKLIVMVDSILSSYTILMKRAPRTFVLEEDQHLENLRKIIKRDFFDGSQDEAPINLTLNQYLSNFKSTEGQFFSQMVQLNKDQWKKEHWWIGKQDKLLMLQEEKRLAIQPQPFHNMIQKNAEVNGIDRTIVRQQALNSFFFNRDKNYGSLLDQESEKSKKILYNNCRLQEKETKERTKQPQIHARSKGQYQNIDIPSTPLLQGEGFKDKSQQDYIGVGGKQYKRLKQPQPQPDQAPMMTWGQICSTPLRISGPQYSIPQTPEREEVLISLNQKITKQQNKGNTKKSDLVNRILLNSMTPMQLSRSRANSSIRRASKRRLDIDQIPNHKFKS